jgi:hypothetical protein
MRIRRRDLIGGAVAAGMGVATAEAVGRNIRLSGGSVTSPTPPGSPFVTATTVGSTRTDSGSVYRGYTITVGSQPLTLTALGRWVGPLNGSVHTHTFWVGQYLPDPVVGPHGFMLLGTNVTVDISTGTPGTYKYASVPAGIALWPGQTYYILSFELGGGAGDTWYDGNILTTTADASINHAAQFDPGTGLLTDFSGTLPYVPVNFQYNVGTGGPAMATGTVVPGFDLEGHPAFIPSIPRIATGTVVVSGTWPLNGDAPTGSIVTYQWMLDGVPYSPVLTHVESGNHVVLDWSFDTTLVADGTHHIYPRLYDCDLTNISRMTSLGITFVIANHGFNNGSQVIPTSFLSPQKPGSPVPDFVFFDHTNPNPSHTAHAFPYTFIPPVSDVSSPYHSNPALLIGNTNWVGERWVGAGLDEYQKVPRYATTGSGGVFVDWVNPGYGPDIVFTYQQLSQLNMGDGTRFNALLSPDVNFAEDPAGGGKWWAVEITGRVYSITSTGGAVAVVGGTQDKTQLSREANQVNGDSPQIFLGNWSGAPDVDFGGGNDLCFDPRNSNLLYVVAAIDNWIGKIDLSTSPATVTVYAGVPGSVDAYTEGAATPVHTTGSITTGGAMVVASGSGIATGMIVGGEGVAAVGGGPTVVISGSGTSWTVTAQSNAVPGGTTLYIGAATLAAPVSIIMADGTGPLPIGTMIVSDQNNHAIRKITSPSTGVAGTVSTFLGGTLGPTPPTLTQLSHTTPYNVTSITWDNTTPPGVGTVVMASATTIKLGYTLQLSGATNTGGSGNPNTGLFAPTYIVSHWIDSQHFSVIFEPATGNPNPGGVTIGTLSGPMVFTQLDGDLYSSPTAVAFASAYTPWPMALAFTTAGNIVQGENASTACRLISLNTTDGQAANTISRINSFNGMFRVTGPSWQWLDCDPVGAAGPVNGITMTHQNANSPQSAHGIWQCALGQRIFDGVSIGLSTYTSTFGADGNPPDNDTIQQVGTGHYPWAIKYSRKEPRMVATGFLGQPPTFLRPLLSSDPVFTFNSQLYFEGNKIIGPTGTADGFPYLGLRPAFWSLYGQGMGPFINAEQSAGAGAGKYTCEDLANTFPSSAFGDAGSVALGNYIRSGMGGAVPRPEITGNDDRSFQYSIYRTTRTNTLAPTVYQPGPQDPDIVTPLILTMTPSRVDGTHIMVTWTTSKPTVGLIMAGTPHQFANYGAYTMWSPLSTPSGGYGTSHSATCQVLSGYTPVHFVILVKDVAGNFAHTVDQTVT